MNNTEDLLTRISSEIDVLIQELKQKSSFYINSNSINKAQDLLSITDSLIDMKSELERIQNDYSSFSTEQVRIAGPEAATRKPNKALRVEFPDGTIIKEYTAVSTFVKTIGKIGVSEVKSLNLPKRENPNSKYDLITLYPIDNQIHNYRQIDNYYVRTISSTQEKAKRLKKISSLLDLHLKIDVIEV